MTDRERFDRRSGWVMIPPAAGFLIVAIGVVVSQTIWPPALISIVLPGSALIVIATTIGQTAAFRCSVCRGNLAPLAFAYLSWRFNPRVRFCPYCAADIDAELQTEPAPEVSPPDRVDAHR